VPDRLASSPLGASDAASAPEHRFADALVLRERPFVAKVSLRGDPDDRAFASGVERALGTTLPSDVGGVAEGPCTIFALAPDEWLVVAAGPAGDIVSKLEAELVGMHMAAVDVSSATTIIEAAGAHALDVIAKGGAVDISAVARPRCCQMRLARFPVLIYAPSGLDRYDVFVERSIAATAWNWLQDAAASCI